MGLGSFFKRDNKEEFVESHIDINDEECVGCEKCITVCPNHVFVLKDKKCSVRDSQVCKSCRVCMAICPNDCIKVN